MKKQNKYPREESEPHLGEVRLREWVAARAQAEGLSFAGVYQRLRRGFYANVSIRHANHYYVFVREVAA